MRSRKTRKGGGKAWRSTGTPGRDRRPGSAQRRRRDVEQQRRRDRRDDRDDEQGRW